MAESSGRPLADLSWLAAAAAAEGALSELAAEGAHPLSQLAAELCWQAALAETGVRALSKVSLPLSPLPQPVPLCPRLV